MRTVSQRQTSPRDIARILFRQWRKSALFICGVTLLALLVVTLYPRSYASEAKLLIRVGRESVGLDPTATTGETFTLQKTQDDEVNSAINILTSRAVLEHVVERIGAARILHNQPAGKSTSPEAEAQSAGVRVWIGRTLELIGLSDPGTDMDRAVRLLQSKTSVSAQKQSMVITVDYTAASPELAHDVVEAMTKVFLQEHSRLSQTDGSLEFFEEQVAKLHGELMVAQAKLRDRKNAYQLTTGANRQSIVEKSKDAMRKKLFDLEIQETEVRSRFTDDYPYVRELRRQHEMAQKSLLDTPSTPTASEANGSKPQPSKLDTELQTLNGQEFELAQLEREVQLLEGKYKMHVQKLEQARLNDALGREQISNVKVAQPATLVYKPVSPKKPLVLGLGLAAALFGGLGLAFVAEVFDQTLRTTDQVEMQLGVPVLASLPHRKRRRKLLRGLTVTASTKTASAKSIQPGSSQRGSYSGLLTALLANGENGHPSAKMVGVVGCGTSKVRSQIAGNIAIQAANDAVDPVLLIDGDARRQRIAKRFRLNGAPGWRQLMAGSAVADKCVQWSKPSNLAVMGPGNANGDVPGSVSTSNTLGDLNKIATGYGLVIVDLPSTQELEGSSAAPEWIDEIVLVVDAERTRVQVAQRTINVLDRAGIRVTGVVLANRREHIPRWLYQRL
jgi:polysaccharide biosynthesis transport protein